MPNISATWNCKSITEPFPHEWHIQALGNTTESEYGQCFKPVFLLSKQTEKSRSPRAITINIRTGCSKVGLKGGTLAMRGKRIYGNAMIK